MNKLKSPAPEPTLDPVLVDKTLDQFQREAGEWADGNFTTSTVASIISHFREEAGEFADEPSGEEAADCLLLLIHYAHKSGISLYQEAERKLAINRKRIWKTTPEPGGHIKHVGKDGAQ